METPAQEDGDRKPVHPWNREDTPTPFALQSLLGGAGAVGITQACIGAGPPQGWNCGGWLTNAWLSEQC